MMRYLSTIAVLSSLVAIAAANGRYFGCTLVPSNTCPEEGENITLTCDCKVKPGQFYIYDDPDWRKWTSASVFSLTVDQADFDADWVCWAKENGFENEFFHGKIYERPTVTLTITPNCTFEGESVEFKATVVNPDGVEFMVKFWGPNGQVFDATAMNGMFVYTLSNLIDYDEGYWRAMLWSPQCDDIFSPKKTLEVKKRPTVDLTVDPNPAKEGNSSTVSFTITNPDSITITNIVVTSPQSVTTNFPTNVVNGDVVLDPVSVNDDEGTWTVTVTYTHPATGASEDATDTEDLDVIEIPEPDMSITPGLVIERDSFTVSWTIDNPDSIPIISITLFDPQGNSYDVTGQTSFTFPNADEPTHNGTWRLEVVAHGCVGPAETTAELVITPRPDEEFTNGCDVTYRFVYKRRTRDAAAAYCQNKGMKLAPVLDDLERQLIRNQAPASNVPYFTGFIRSPTGWRSNLCTQDVPWPVSKIQNNFGGGNCTGITASNIPAQDLLIEAVDCSDEKFFVCTSRQECSIHDDYPVSFGGHTYYAIKFERNRDDAEHYCQFIDPTGGLFTIELPPEMLAVCQPMIDQGTANETFWTAPTDNSGTSDYTSCGFDIPAAWTQPTQLLFKNSTESRVPAGQRRCVALVADVYEVVPCEKCRYFICEIAGC